MNKRGVSPLIAAILLIAFLAAFIIVIVTWVGSLSECGSFTLRFVKDDAGEPVVCFDKKASVLQFEIENLDHKDIEELRIEIVGDEDVLYETSYDEERIEQSTRTGIAVDYNAGKYGLPLQIKIRPLIMSGDKLKYCPSKDIVAPNVPTCEV